MLSMNNHTGRRQIWMGRGGAFTGVVGMRPAGGLRTCQLPPAGCDGPVGAKTPGGEGNAQ